MSDGSAPPELEEALLRYLIGRQVERDDWVRRALDVLPEGERTLLHEAAVMGYLKGYQDAQVSRPFRTDADIVWLVVDACRAFGDLYPVISKLGDTP